MTTATGDDEAAAVKFRKNVFRNSQILDFFFIYSQNQDKSASV